MNLQGQSGSSPAIDRNKGLHNVLDQAKDKYKIVFEDTAAFDRAKGLSMTESALAGMKTPPDVINCANDDMALGALEALKARNLVGKVKLIGFDALPEALGQIKAGNMTATIEQMPGGQVKGALDTLVAYLRDGKKPAEPLKLLTPIAITSDNLNQAERLNEVK
jgi:ribose transport system substrate-binding protein/inositol transport system substrate-binding protein